MSAAAHGRVLRWEGCLNVRDLGGLPAGDGKTTRFGAVVRCDSIHELSEGGWRTLVDYGVRSVVDLRADDECAGDRPREPALEVVRVPINPRDDPVNRAWPSTREAYLALLERFRPEFARAVAAVARAERAVVVHCAGGRDRTGLTVALLLRLADVDLDTIAADHALSDDSFAPTLEEWFAEAPDEDERDRRRRIAVPAGRTIADVLAELERRHASVREYLLDGGAGDEDLRRARAQLVG